MAWRHERRRTSSPPPPEVIAKARQLVQETFAANERHKRLFGAVPPPVQAHAFGHRLVGIGNQLFSMPPNSTFPAVLSMYTQHVFGSGCWEDQDRKPEAERHPVVQWHAHVERRRQEAVADVDGYVKLRRDGPMNAFTLLGYDLFVLRHQDKLQKDIVRRLRRPDHFEGARYELFVAATFIRAGFTIVYADESDLGSMHPEFVGTHKATGLAVAVEAKAKSRRDAAQAVPADIGVRNLLYKAATKRGAEAYIVFVDLNLPPGSAHQRDEWHGQFVESATLVGSERPTGGVGDLLFCTNVLHQQTLPDDPNGGFYVMAANDRIPGDVARGLAVAVQQFGHVPDLPIENVDTAPGAV